jgi:hypothetical protein
MSYKESVVELFGKNMKQADICRTLGISKGYVHIILRNAGLKRPPPSRLDRKTIATIGRKYTSGFSVKEIQEELGLSEYDVEMSLGNKFRNPGDSNHMRAVRESPSLTRKQEQLILGSLLGDASITKSENRGYYIQVTHSEKQFGYAEHKARLLKVNLTDYVNHGFSRSRMFKAVYKNAAVSEYLETLVLMGGKKCVNQAWVDKLTMEGIAYWFMDDGCSVKKRYCIAVNFSTLGFTRTECEILVQKLLDFGFRSTIQRARKCKTGDGLVISVSTKDTEKFIAAVRPYVWPIECMRYKIKTHVKLPRKSSTASRTDCELKEVPSRATLSFKDFQKDRKPSTSTEENH